MTRFTFLLSLAVWLSSACISSAEPIGIPIVNFDEGPTLLSIFKGGLRPLNVWQDENRKCEVRPAVMASFKAGGITIPPLRATWEFKFNGDDTVYLMTGYGDTPMTVSDACKLVAPLETALGGDVVRMKQWLEAYPDSSINSDTWGCTKWTPNGIKISYSFLHSMDLAKPFGLKILVEWPMTAARRSERTTPLQPPPGYEDFDMRPMSARGMDNVKVSMETGAGEKSTNPNRNETRPKTGVPSASSSESGDSPWPWLVVLVMLLIAGTVWWNACRKA